MKKLLYLIILAFFISCSSNKTEENIEVTQKPSVSKGSVTFSDKQMDISEIKTGQLKKQTLSETIECTGFLEVPPDNIASVSPIITGFVKTLNYFPGDAVSKGAVLATLEHPDFIKLQQQYLEAKSQAEYYEQEYKRQGELTVENAASIKKMQRAKADYLSSEATYKSLKSQLELLGINPGSIEKGNFVKEFKLVAPISGKVSQLNANRGKLVNTEDFVYEIINNETLYVHFKIFERDIPKIKVGQKTIFWLLDNDYKYEVKIQRIGAKVDYTERITMAHSKINNKSKKLKPGMFINASIYINERETYTIPSEALVEYEGNNYIFAKNQQKFELMKVNKGIEQNNFTEILNPGDKLLKSDIVTNGTYYVLSKLEAEE